MSLRNRGFTLVEIMVAAGLIGILALALMRMTSTSMKTMKTASSTSEINQIVGEMRSMLATPTACENSFQGLNANDSGPISQLRNDTNEDRYILNKKYNGVTIESIRLSSAASEVSVNSGSTGETHLVIQFNKGKNTYSEELVKKIKLWVQVDPSDAIIDCRTLSDGESTIFSRSATDPNDIYYNAGNVGIGTNSPVTKLDVNGGIKIGNQATCNASVEGTMKYNSSDKAMEFCDGTQWKKVGGTPTCKVLEKNLPPTHSCGGGYCAIQTVNCEEGWVRTGGGCSNSWYDGHRIVKDYPVGSDGWRCVAQPDSRMTQGKVFVICCQ
ncbi:type II secretion system protein [Halobacteriovorax sp.]|uniref:type II secretion system protein n=1 Tax=Halobacteriovorax sp. TaxID=2020862 RepID=UPI003AF2984F